MAAPQKLTNRQQQSLVKKYQRGTPVSELTQKFEVSTGTVRATVRRHGGNLRPVGRPSKNAEA